MITIIAGSRKFADYNLMCETIRYSGITITQVVCGTAKKDHTKKTIGADQLGEEWGLAHGVPVTYVPADWDLYGKRAGMIRNAEMAKMADALIAFWDGSSPGTKNMIDIMRQKNALVHICMY